jgi:hypothetical protein
MLCAPALLYLIIGILSICYYITKYSVTTVLMKAVFVALWTIVLNYICSKGYEVVSWVLVLLPFILIGLFMLIILEHVGKEKFGAPEKPKYHYGHKEDFGAPMKPMYSHGPSPMENFVSPIGDEEPDMNSAMLKYNVPTLEQFRNNSYHKKNMEKFVSPIGYEASGMDSTMLKFNVPTLEQFNGFR